MGIYLGGSSISGVMSGTPEVKEEIFHGITYFAVPENNEANMWTWTEDLDGIPLQHKKIIVRVYSAKGDGTQDGNIELVYNWSSLCCSSNCVKTDNYVLTTFVLDSHLFWEYGEPNRRVPDARCMQSGLANVTDQTTWVTRGCGVPFGYENLPLNGIDQISIRGNLPAGSTILICGVRI